MQSANSAGIEFVRSGTRSGTPLMLLHGIGSNAMSFASLIAQLSDRRDLIAWDAPGYGGSAPLTQAWPSADDYAGALAQLLDRLGIGKLDLLGHSLGAMMAGRFAALFPDRLERLILSSPALGYATPPGAALAAQVGPRLEALINEGGAAFAATRAPKLVFQRDNAELVAAVTSAMAAVKLPGYQQASRLLSCGDLLADAQRITARTLVVVGARDEVTTPDRCRHMYQALVATSPHLDHRFELVERAGHALAQEQPKALAQVIDAFAPATGG